MGPLQPRATSVSITTYVATVVVLGVWLFAAVVVALCLGFRQRHEAQRTQRTSSFNRSASYGNANPRFPPSDPTALPPYPQRVQAPSYPPTGPSSLSAATTLSELRPIRTPSQNIDPVPPGASMRSQDSGHTTTVSPTKNRVPPAAPSSNEARQQALLACNPSQAAMLARVQTTPLASDTTDMSAETVDPGRQVVNPGYMAMLAQRGIHARDHALLGSDDSTDAGGGAGAGLSYAARARGMASRSMSMDTEMERARFTGQRGIGRAMTLGRGNGNEGLERPVEPLRVRKMSSV